MRVPAAPDAGPVGWLNHEQQLVYQAALFEGDAALDAWKRLLACRPIDDLDPACQRALPMVFGNFSQQGIDSPERPALKETYQWSWARNQLMVNLGREAIAGLGQAGVEHILLKGSALMFLDYRDTGVRPMADVDILVRPEEVEPAIAALSEIGWRSVSARSPERIPLLWEDQLKNEQGLGLDLHWRVVLGSDPEDDLWAQSVPLDFGGAESRSLGAADRLVHVCVHGLSPSYPPAIRWAADAATIVRRNDIDWDRVVAQARHRRISLLMSRALEYVHGAFRVDVPASALQTLNAGPHSRLERAEIAVTFREMNLLDLVRWHWYRYRRVEPSRLRAVIGYPRYLKVLLAYDQRGPFLTHVLRRLLTGARRAFHRDARA